MPAPAGGAGAGGSPLFPVAGRKPRRRPAKPAAKQAPAPRGKQPPLAKKGYVPKRKRGIPSSGVTQTIQCRGPKEFVGERLAPFAEVKIAGEHRGRTLVALGDQVMEVLVLASLE